MATKTKKTTRGTPAKKAVTPPRRRAAPAAAGPLTLAQARAIVQAAQPAVAPRAAKAPARRRASRGAVMAAAAEVTPASIAIERRKLAIRDREELKQRLRDYKATFALLQKRGVKGLPTAAASPARRRAPGAAAAAPSGLLRVFAEGDSWFDYPVPFPLFFGGGLVPRLENRLGVPILSLATAGDESRNMLGVEQRKLIARHFRDGCPDGSPWELMLFSGGGNDIVSNPLALWLRDFRVGVPPAQLLHGPRFATALALVRAAYEDLIELRNLFSPQTQLVFHAYDFAIPDGRGICHLGPWLKPAFDLRGFPADLVASSAVVREMLQQFAAMLAALATQPRVAFINAQDTLAPVKASWHNEMHPSKAGFNQIADVFHAGIKALFPGRVL